MVKRKMIATLIILLQVTLLISQYPAKAATAFRNLEAKSAILAEIDTGEVLYESNMNIRHPADALARVMTMSIAISAIENGETEIDEIVEMTETALFDITADNTTLGISPGDEMTLHDLMYCAFVGGANEACNLIAEHIAGSIPEFVKMMNERAKELGCEGTHFTNPHGQYSERQYTTALDQFKIYRNAISFPLFGEISGTYRHTISSGEEGAKELRLTSTNMLLNANNNYYYRHCTSGTTSSTFEGGLSFAGFAESEGLSLIIIILGSHDVVFDDKTAELKNLTEARRLLEWGFDNYGWRTILSATELVEKAPIIHGAGADYVNMRPEFEKRIILEKDVKLEEFVRDIVIYSEKKGEPLYAPIKAGAVLGEITLTRRGEKYGPIQLIANTSVDLHRLEFMRIQLKDMLASPTAHAVMFALILLLALYIALVIRYNVLRVRRIRKIKEAKRKLIEERRQVNEVDGNDPRLKP